MSFGLFVHRVLDDYALFFFLVILVSWNAVPRVGILAFPIQ